MYHTLGTTDAQTSLPVRYTMIGRANIYLDKVGTLFAKTKCSINIAKIR